MNLGQHFELKGLWLPSFHTLGNQDGCFKVCPVRKTTQNFSCHFKKIHSLFTKWTEFSYVTAPHVFPNRSETTGCHSFEYVVCPWPTSFVSASVACTWVKQAEAPAITTPGRRLAMKEKLGHTPCRSECWAPREALPEGPVRPAAEPPTPVRP